MYKDGDRIIAEEGEPWDQDVMSVNTSRSHLLRNIKNNIRKQLPQLNGPYGENFERVAVVGGGWSLNDTFDELRDLYFEGVQIVSMNGSGRWLMERNMKPAMHVMLDARPENVEFVKDAIPGCKYFFASQIDPSIIDACEGRNVTLFHAVSHDATPERARLDDHYDKHWIPVPPSSTVGLTSIMLLRLLGFRTQHLFGVDSCYDPKERRHHAFPQEMNENEGTAIFRIVGKEFEAAPWMAAQVQSFLNIIQINGALLDLTIHGDGMLAHIVKTGADFVAENVKENSNGSASRKIL